jgi:hypothetical protein
VQQKTMILELSLRQTYLQKPMSTASPCSRTVNLALNVLTVKRTLPSNIPNLVKNIGSYFVDDFSDFCSNVNYYHNLFEYENHFPFVEKSYLNMNI